MNSKQLHAAISGLGFKPDDIAAMAPYAREFFGLPEVIPEFDYNPIQRFTENYLPRLKLLRSLVGLDKQISIEPPFDLKKADNAQAFGWYNEQVSYEQDRGAVYDLVEEMDRWDFGAAALDVYAEEATQTDLKSGRAAWVESGNPKIKAELMNLFNRLGLEDSIRGITRGLCKFGDDFEQIIASADDGVIALEHVSPRKLTRVDDRNGILKGFAAGLVSEYSSIGNKPGSTNSKLELSKPWEFLHFRLQSSRREVKHGESVLRAGFRVYRQLKILEDMLVLYRINRATDKDIYYIDTGASTVDQQWQAVNNFRRHLRKRIFYNPTTGSMRQQYEPRTADEDMYIPIQKDSQTRVDRLKGANPIGEIYDIEFFRDKWFGAVKIPKCLRGDTTIPLCDGTTATIKQLAESRANDKFWVWSRDADYNVVPGLAHSPRVTGIVDTLTRVTLDSGQVIDATPQHLFMLRDGTYCPAGSLRPGDSLSPFYAFVAGDKDKLAGYLRIQSGKRCHFKYAHRLAGESAHGPIPPGYVVHHKNFAKLDNSPDNLQVLPCLRAAGMTFTALTKQHHGRSNREAATFGRNHKVASVDIIRLAIPEPVYDISVDRWHNFALAAGVFVHNSFLGFEGDVNAKSTLTNQSIRFARSIKWVQRAVRHGLTHLCRIHLALKGINYKDPGNKFTVKMAAASSLDEIAAAEVWRVKTEIATMVMQLGQMCNMPNGEAWIGYVLKEHMGVGDEEISVFITPSPNNVWAQPINPIELERDKEEQKEKAAKEKEKAKKPEKKKEDAPPSAAIAGITEAMNGSWGQERKARFANAIEVLRLVRQDDEIECFEPTPEKFESTIFDLDEEQKKLEETLRGVLTENPSDCPSCGKAKLSYHFIKSRNSGGLFCAACNFVATPEGVV